MEKLKSYFKEYPEILNLLIFLICGAALVIITNHMFSVFAPFIIAYVVTRLLRPAMVFMKTKLKMHNAISAFLCLIVFGSITGSVVWFIVGYVADGVKYLINLLSSPDTINEIVVVATNIYTKFEDAIAFLDIEITVKDIASVVSDITSKIISVLSSSTIGVAVKVPNILLALIIGIVSAFYMMFDYDNLANAINSQLSPKTKRFVDLFNTQVLFSFMKMIMSYVLVSAICFAELAIGFLILGIKDAMFIALVIAILDVLPIIGSGAVLVPWGIVMLALGNPFVGIGLIVLWIIIVVVRQIIEPKIVGSQIGLHSLVTIASLFVGLKLMGGLGLIVCPLYIILCKKMVEEGLISSNKSAQEAKEEISEVELQKSNTLD